MVDPGKERPAKGPRPGKEAPDGGKRPARDTRSVGDPRFSGTITEPTPGPTPETARTFDFVRADRAVVRCKSAFVTVRQQPLFLVSTEGGTHEFSRVYFYDDHFSMGMGNDKIGPMSLVSATFDVIHGLDLLGHDGRRLWAPAALCQVTYTP
jgi:hypothetical protein